MRAALRQAPKVILVGEMRDRETIEIALEAAETGHLVMSTLHTIDASKTVERIIGVFPIAEQHIIRSASRRASATSFRSACCRGRTRRPRRGHRNPEIHHAHPRIRRKRRNEGKSLLDAMRDGDLDGMQCFDDVIERMIRADIIDIETGLGYATNPGNLTLSISDLIETKRNEESEFER